MSIGPLFDSAVTAQNYTPVYPLRLRRYEVSSVRRRCTLCSEVSATDAAGWAWDFTTGHFAHDGMPPGDFCGFCADALVAQGRAVYVDSLGHTSQLIPRD